MGLTLEHIFEMIDFTRPLVFDILLQTTTRHHDTRVMNRSVCWREGQKEGNISLRMCNT